MLHSRSFYAAYSGIKSMMYLPKMRLINALPASHEGRQMVLLQDPLGLAKKSVLIPPEITPLLALCDGSREIEQIHEELKYTYGFDLPQKELIAWLNLLDDAALLDNTTYMDRKTQVLEAYRDQPHRPMTLADDIYPTDPDECRQTLDTYLELVPPQETNTSMAGMICPHIDYFRGWRVYAQVMAQARQSIEEADLIIVLGTDHFDDGNPISLTLQKYKTPYGVLETDQRELQVLADSLIEVDVFRGELRHRFEHSIELALVWIHHLRQGKPFTLLPILCGSHDLLMDGKKGEQQWVGQFLENLEELSKERNTFIVAAADLAHVGLAFGGRAIPAEVRSEVALADEKLLQRVKEGNPRAFIDEINAVDDRNNVCGITPIYLLLRLLQPTEGQVVAYELCPADQDETSWVSICGALLS